MLPESWQAVNVAQLSPADFAELQQRIPAAAYESLEPAEASAYIDVVRAANTRSAMELEQGVLSIDVRGSDRVGVPWWLWALVAGVGGWALAQALRGRR